jgi:hypothetical protein
MFYRISIILGTLISLLFVLFCSYFLFIDQMMASAGRSVSAIFLVTNLFFLFSDFICFKINKCNIEQRLIPLKLKTIGKFLFVLTIISIVVVLFSGFAGLLSRLYSEKVIAEKQTISFFVIITLMLLSGILAIINLIYFRKVSRKNNTIINQLIDDIQLT